MHGLRFKLRSLVAYKVILPLATSIEQRINMATEPEKSLFYVVDSFSDICDKFSSGT
jgi:hypothetical protein